MWAEKLEKRMAEQQKQEESNKQGVEANYNTSTGTIRDGKYYCILCDAGGWAGPSGLWYHMKRVHNAKSRNYNKHIPEKKKKEKTRKKRLKAWDIKKNKDDANLLLGFAEGAVRRRKYQKRYY